MIRQMLFLTAAVLTGNQAFAVSEHKVSKCKYEEVESMDASLLDVIKANNFESGTVYTAVKLTSEKEDYSGAVGNGLVFISKSGIQLTEIALCTTSSKERFAMDASEVSFSDLIDLGALSKSDKPETRDLTGDYLQSDEHVAMKGSSLTLTVVERKGTRVTVEAKIKLIVADLTQEENSDIGDEDDLKATEKLEGKFYFSFADVKLK